MLHCFKDQSIQKEDSVDKKKGKGKTDLDDPAKRPSLSLLAVDVNEFMWDKFLNDVEVAEKEFSGFDLMSSFKEIIEVLKQKDKRSLCSILASTYPPLLQELNDILAEFQIHSTKRRQVVQNLLLSKPPIDRKDRLRYIKTTLEEIDVEEPSTQLVLVSSLVQELTYREMPGEPVTTSELIGLDDHMKNIKESLIGNGSSKCGFKAIGLIGMCGTGKTALAQSIFNDPEVSATFHPRIWLRSSHPMEKEVDKLKVMMFVFEELGYDFDELRDFSITELLEAMNRLLTGQRYLIVVDEVWCTDDWFEDSHKKLEAERDTDRFSRGLPKDSGGALLVTTRIPELGKRMVGDDNLYHLKPLDTEKCLEISRNYIEKFNLDEKKVSRSIEHHGFGLPLAAKVFVEIERKLSQHVG